MSVVEKSKLDQKLSQKESKVIFRTKGKVVWNNKEKLENKTNKNNRENKSVRTFLHFFILFHLILFYFILFYFILFYFFFIFFF